MNMSKLLEQLEKELGLPAWKILEMQRAEMADPSAMRMNFLNGTLYATHYAYSDINPYEVLRVVSDNCLEVRAMNHENDPNDMPTFVPGGFSAICTHFGSRVISVDPKGKVFKIRRTKRNPERWTYKGMRFALDKEPRAYYDHNF
jgi:hypothetical protein